MPYGFDEDEPQVKSPKWADEVRAPGYLLNRYAEARTFHLFEDEAIRELLTVKPEMRKQAERAAFRSNDKMVTDARNSIKCRLSPERDEKRVKKSHVT